MNPPTPAALTPAFRERGVMEGIGALPVIGVLALQGDVREHVRALEESGATARPVRRLSEIEAADGLVIPGGEATTLGKVAAAALVPPGGEPPPLGRRAPALGRLEPIQKLIADGLPAFGSCAGLIM